MRLLIVTQAVDTEDPVLGFFVRWIEEFAKHVERIEVICLREGKHALPANVRVHSLGKERIAAENTIIYDSVFRRVRYAWRFLSLVWKLRDEYDAVFVHMNQEYVLLAGWFWRLLGKRVYLWRNHYAGSLLTDMASLFCNKIFCTSKHSYTARYRKTVLMPVGVNTERFSPDTRVARAPHSILFLARMAPSKRPEMLLDALTELAGTNVDFTATFVGSPLPQDERYYRGIKERARTLLDRISFVPGVPQNQTPDLYRAHDIFVNTSPSGMLDKTLFEAAASGCLVLAASEDFADALGREAAFSEAQELAARLKTFLAMPPDRRDIISQKLKTLVAHNALTALATALSREIDSSS